MLDWKVVLKGGGFQEISGPACCRMGPNSSAWSRSKKVLVQMQPSADEGRQQQVEGASFVSAALCSQAVAYAVSVQFFAHAQHVTSYQVAVFMSLEADELSNVLGCVSQRVVPVQFDCSARNVISDSGACAGVHSTCTGSEYKPPWFRFLWGGAEWHVWVPGLWVVQVDQVASKHQAHLHIQRCGCGYLVHTSVSKAYRP